MSKEFSFKLPAGAHLWWKNPRATLTEDQLYIRREYDKRWRAFRRSTDPEFKAKDRAAYMRCIDKDRPKAYTRNAAWRKTNWPQVLESRRRPNYRIASVMRGRICKAVKAQKAIKSASLLELLGCNLTELKAGMSWANYGNVWHIDHRRPCASFDLTDAEQQRHCFHFSNLQPMFAMDNLRKSANF